MICSPVEVTQHKCSSSHLQCRSKIGQNVCKPLISITLPGDDVVKGIVGIVVGAVIAECGEPQLQIQIGQRSISEIRSKAHSREGVAFGNVSIELVVLEESKSINIKIKRFDFNGVCVATCSELMTQIGFSCLRKGYSGEKDSPQEKKKTTQARQSECGHVFHK